MLKKITKWETEDGKVFDTQEEAEEYMFEQEKEVMTHTSTEQPEALRLADIVERLNVGVHSQAIAEEYSAAARELRRLHARVQELADERYAIIAEKNEYKIAFRAARLELEAAQAQRVPLSEKQVEDLIYAKHFRKSCAQLSYASTQVNLNWYRLGLRDGERAHGITQEKQG